MAQSEVTKRQTQEQSQNKTLRVFTDLNEIFEHNTQDSLWLLIDNKVYDVTDF